jgi:hypothetical protein
MTVPLQSPQHSTTTHLTRAHGTGFRVTEWALGIIGAIAAFVGAFILLGGDDQSVGLGGEASWQVGEIDPAWGFGLLIGGAIALAVALALAIHDRNHRTPGEPASSSGMSDVLAHAAIFLVVNAFLWIQDIAIGGGLNYAYWVTIPWGIGLVAHALTVSREERRAVPG